MQIALQLVRQGVSNEPTQEAAIVTASEEPNGGDSANKLKDETMEDPATENAAMTNADTASKEASELDLLKRTVDHDVHPAETPKEAVLTDSALSTDKLCTPEVVLICCCHGFLSAYVFLLDVEPEHNAHFKYAKSYKWYFCAAGC